PSGICPLACARPRPLPAKFDPNMRGCRRMGFAQASKAAIYWPFPPATGHAPRVKNNRRDRSDMPKIALVDDDQNILTSISMALEAEGFTVERYTDGASALSALSKNPADLGVFDIKMPRMDGME